MYGNGRGVSPQEDGLPIREVCLKSEYAAWYPGLSVGEWIGAFTAQYLVGLQLRYGEPRWEAGDRLLNPDHFLFRGGTPSALRTFERRQPPRFGAKRTSSEEAAPAD